MKEYARVVVRYAICFVFLWFGINQLVHPSDFMGYLPDFLLSLDYAGQLVLLNGAFEVLMGLILLIGWQVRIVALVLSLHLLTITAALGYNDIAIRDFTLALVTFSIFIGGKDICCKDFGK